SNGDPVASTQTPKNTTQLEAAASTHSLAMPTHMLDRYSPIGQSKSPLAKKSQRHTGDETESSIPRTPLKLDITTEIPPSIQSIATPMVDKYSPIGDARSPLQDKSANTVLRRPELTNQKKRPRDLVVEDSWSPEHSP